MSKNYLTTNGLMKHLRASGIDIHGSYQKRQLVNHGYFHGYKGYRFFNSPSNRIPFTDYTEVIALIKYDNSIKSLFYPQLMFIETALKNIVLEIVLKQADSRDINAVFTKLIPGFQGAPTGTSYRDRRDMQSKKLRLQNTIHHSLQRAYDTETKRTHGKKVITHFYHNNKYTDVPVWAIFETLTLGDFGTFISCLNQPTRNLISDYLGLDTSGDTNSTLPYKIVYVIKDLRNAVAHNDIVFDTRFRNTDIGRPLEVCLIHDVGVRYANFKSIVDYFVLASYLLKKLKIPKTEILGFISSYERTLNDLKKGVNSAIFSQVVHPDTSSKINDLRTFVKR
ncbi:Abi family protein [Alicyclobacillus tolerans]|uniref:Abi family protein n=1 Tax=Alicyclobacillus tolerans TaxID=90970 RepID=UPI003B82188C